jgi:hypothetical protein
MVYEFLVMIDGLEKPITHIHIPFNPGIIKSV